MKLVISIILIIVSALGFVIYIVPTYAGAKELREKKNEYETVLSQAKQLKKTRDDLLKRVGSFDPTDLSKIEDMLPGGPENMQFILELNGAAQRVPGGMTLQNVKVLEDDTTVEARRAEGSAKVTPEDGPFSTLRLEFTVIGPYPAFVEFLDTLERSLRVTDIERVAFVALDDRQNYQYTVGVKTYWVR